MELPILAVLLSSFILIVGSHPKNSDVIPKDYYKRQILQPIPGYIPVYIKADGVPLVRTQAKKHTANVTPEKVSVFKEKNLSEPAENDNLSKNQKKKSNEIKTENPVTEMKTQQENVTKKIETTLNQSKNEKQVENTQVKVDDFKP